MNIFENNGRSNVLSDSGMAATSHPLASLEAITILKEGGKAFVQSGNIRNPKSEKR